MSNINCSLDDVDSLIKSLELVIYVPIFVFGLFLNVLALCMFCKVLKKWTESSIYMTNLALMDLLLLLQLPFKMHATNHIWPAGMKTFCSFLESLYFLSMYGSIYIIVVISVDRYINICHPFQAKHKRSKKTARIVCVVIWVIVSVATTPVYTFRPKEDSEFRCFHGFSDGGWHPALILSLEVFGFILPTVVLTYCSARSIRALRNPNATISPEREAGIRIIYSSLCAFLVPFTPCHIAIFLQYLVRSRTITECKKVENISLFVQLAISLANITVCLDAICYYFIIKELRLSKDIIRQSISRMKSVSSSET